MRKVLIGLLVLLLLMSIVAPAASAFVWSPPFDLGIRPIRPLGPMEGLVSGLSLRLPAYKIPKLPDWIIPLPTEDPAPTVRPDEIKMTLSDAEKEALCPMYVGEWVPVYFVLREAFANDKLIWSSDNESVAVAITSILIDPMGREARILATGSGRATITVRTADDSFFYQFQVCVN